MKYKAVYEVLNQQRNSSPGFQYSDHSGWRSPQQTYMTLQRPLWIIAEDPAAGRRLWITQDGRQLSITVGRMDVHGHNCGTALYLVCANRTQLAEKLRELFTLPPSVA